MDDSQEECPVCKDKIRNPSQPSPCCNKIICQSCLGQSLRFRAHCPHCRTPVTNPLRPVTDRRRLRRSILMGHETFIAGRTVSSNIQNCLNQLQAAQAAQANAANQASLPNQNAPGPAPVPQSQAPPLSITTGVIIPPAPFPRARPQPAIFTTIRPAAVPAPPPAPLYHNPAQENLEDELDDLLFQTEVNEMVMRQEEQTQGSTLTTLVCPYCQMGGLDALNLRDHCNAQHANDSRRLVCPVCVVLPHGDPQYYSRNFIGHLNLRHCYYIEHITNIHQNDDVNFQCALLASCNENIRI